MNSHGRRTVRRQQQRELRDAMKPLLAAADQEEFTIRDGPLGFELRIVTATGKHVRRIGIRPWAMVALMVASGLIGWVTRAVLGV